jgi:PAS domain S-box-containing protein
LYGRGAGTGVAPVFWQKPAWPRHVLTHLNHLSHHAAWRKQLEMLLESTGEGIYGIDLNGRCVFINRAGAEMLGYTPDEVLGRNMHYLIHHSHANHELMPVHDCRIFKAFKEGCSCRVDDEVLWRQDGSAFPAEYASYPIHDGGNVVGAVVTFSDISERKRIQLALEATHVELERRVEARTAELSAAHDSLRRLAAHLNSIREEERAHIARDIHDELGASFTALQLELNWLRHRIGNNEELSKPIDGMVDMATTALASVRRILNDLRPGVLDHLGLWAALECLLQELQGRTGLKCAYHCSPAVERCRLGRDAEIAIFRIVQEVLTNIQRHAQASNVRFSASVVGRNLVIAISDDGRGMHVPAQPKSFGLLGMKERAIALGGMLDIDSQPGQGTEVTLALRGVAG